MAVLKCTVCGGELEVNADLSVGVCKFCDSIITIPKELDRKGNLYNRAIFLRQNNEFDKALATYEDILKEDNSDAEAHWGLVLSKFGIEYVLDPKTQERIPTCHRTQTQSILSDPDYLAALEHSDIEAQKVIENEAKRINKIQTKILEISQKEEPYDIFICYKETDELGNRTEDSTLAQELYYELKKKGYRIFFARKTLESKLGAEYEPIIFAALNSAKVMIVLGTKAEHFNAVWVRNEWSRFIHLSKDAHKTIIPAYRGMSPYELPAELSALQSQDMSKIGFMQDLTDGIERCMRGETVKKAIAKETVASSFGVASLERLLQNSATYLKLNNFVSAEEVYTTVTKDYPEDYRGWWGLIVCKTRNFTEVMLDQTTTNVWFRYVKQLASSKDFEPLEKTYIEYTQKVSLLAATEDMKSVNGIIQSHNSRIRSLEQEIQSVTEAIKNREAMCKSQVISDNDYISKFENDLSKAQEDREGKTRSTTIGGILITVGVILLLTGGWNILWGIIIGFVGFGFCFPDKSKYGGTFEQIDNRIENIQTQIAKAKRDKDEHKNQFDTDIAQKHQKIADLQEQISGVQGKIADCRKYLDLGKDKIATLWFAEECEAFDVVQKVDSCVSEYRNAAFGVNDVVVEQVTITCPACGEEIVESRSVLIANGFVVCKTCGNTIEISVSSKDDCTNSGATTDAFYSITCPACDQEFNINNETLESGHCNCPSCGMEIEFEDAQ